MQRVSDVPLFELLHHFSFKSSVKDSQKSQLEFICVESLNININTNKGLALEGY